MSATFRPAMRAGAALAALALLGAASDPKNPTCPSEPDWGPARAMTLTPRVVDGTHVLVAEGIIDAGLPQRLKAAIDRDDQLAEIWVRSRGGDARAGNEAGKVIRSFTGMATRIDSYVTSLGAVNGLIDAQETTLERRNVSLDNQIAELERRLEAERTRLEGSFIRMEEAQSLISSQLAALQSTLNLG